MPKLLSRSRSLTSRSCSRGPSGSSQPCPVNTASCAAGNPAQGLLRTGAALACAPTGPGTHPPGTTPLHTRPPVLCRSSHICKTGLNPNCPQRCYLGRMDPQSPQPVRTLHQLWFRPGVAVCLWPRPGYHHSVSEVRTLATCQFPLSSVQSSPGPPGPAGPSALQLRTAPHRNAFLNTC